MIMGLFPGISPTLLAVALAVVTGGVVLVLLGLGTANPILLRMGLRNMTRRPSQTLVLLCGLALSTAVMTASFGLSDSIAASEVQQRLARMGTADESITGPFTQAQVDSALAQLRQDSHVAAASVLFFAPPSPTVTLLRTGLSVHDVDLYAVPPDFDQVYGAITGSRNQVVHFADLRPNEILVSATLTENLHISPGDTLQLSFEPSPSVVRAVLSNDIAVTGGEAVGNALLPKSFRPSPTRSRSTRNRPIRSASRTGMRVAQARMTARRSYTSCSSFFQGLRPALPSPTHWAPQNLMRFAFIRSSRMWSSEQLTSSRSTSWSSCHPSASSFPSCRQRSPGCSSKQACCC